MDIDVIGMIVFLLGLAFWTGVLNNKVATLKDRLDKNDATTDKVPELMVQLSSVVETLKEIKADIHEMKTNMSEVRTDIELLKQGQCK